MPSPPHALVKPWLAVRSSMRQPPGQYALTFRPCFCTNSNGHVLVRGLHSLGLHVAALAAGAIAVISNMERMSCSICTHETSVS